jgi:hypothetical protein
VARLQAFAALLALLALTACRGAAEPRAPHEAPPDGWWVVQAATLGGTQGGRTGTAWRFSPAEYQVVGEGDYVERQRSALEPAAFASEWEGNAPSRYVLRRAGDILVLTTTVPRSTVVLRAASPEEAATAERALAHHGTIDAGCAEAARCFREAVVAMSTSNDAREMAPGTSLHACEQISLGYARLFAQLGRALPEACVQKPR